MEENHVRELEAELATQDRMVASLQKQVERYKGIVQSYETVIQARVTTVYRPGQDVLIGEHATLRAKIIRANAGVGDTVYLVGWWEGTNYKEQWLPEDGIHLHLPLVPPQICPQGTPPEGG